VCVHVCVLCVCVCVCVCVISFHRVITHIDNRYIHTHTHTRTHAQYPSIDGVDIDAVVNKTRDGVCRPFATCLSE